MLTITLYWTYLIIWCAVSMIVHLVLFTKTYVQRKEPRKIKPFIIAFLNLGINKQFDFFGLVGIHALRVITWPVMIWEER
jgi:hypothetical protein